MRVTIKLGVFKEPVCTKFHNHRKVTVKSTIIEVPTMYGDHHVLEVRRILLEFPGVEEVNASSAFRTVEVIYDPAKINDLDIKMRLDESGYLGEWSLPIELGAAAVQVAEKAPFYRHTEVFETSRQVLSFAQNVAHAGRPLWPCPGMGLLRAAKMEE